MTIRGVNAQLLLLTLLGTASLHLPAAVAQVNNEFGIIIDNNNDSFETSQNDFLQFLFTRVRSILVDSLNVADLTSTKQASSVDSTPTTTLPSTKFSSPSSTSSTSTTTFPDAKPRTASACKFKEDVRGPSIVLFPSLFTKTTQPDADIPNANTSSALKASFVSNLIETFPKEILKPLQLQQYEQLFNQTLVKDLNSDDLLQLFNHMYLDVLTKLGLGAQISASQDSDAVNQWEKIGMTTVDPFLKQSFPPECVSNSSSVPSVASTMEYVLKLPVEMSRKISDRSGIPLGAADGMTGEFLLKVQAFVDSLSVQVLTQLVDEYKVGKPYLDTYDSAHIELLAKQDLAEYLASRVLTSRDDWSAYFTNSVKDGLFLSFSLGNIQEDIAHIPGMNELILRIMKLPEPLLKLLAKKGFISLKLSLKFLKEIEKMNTFLRSWPTKLSSKLSSSFSFNNGLFSGKSKPDADLTDVSALVGGSELMPYLGLDSYPFSLQRITSFMTELFSLSYDAFVVIMKDLFYRLDPFSEVAEKKYKKDQQHKQEIDAMYAKYPIIEITAALKGRLMSYLGLGDTQSTVDSSRPFSFFGNIMSGFASVPSALASSFKNGFSWNKSDRTSLVSTQDQSSSQELTEPELEQMMSTFLSSSNNVDDNSKTKILKLLSDAKTPNDSYMSLSENFSERLNGLGSWFQNAGSGIYSSFGSISDWWSGGHKKSKKKKNDNNLFDSGIVPSILTFFGYSNNPTSEDRLSEKDIDELRSIVLQLYGLDNLSEAGMQDVRTASKSVSNLINWNVRGRSGDPSLDNEKARLISAINAATSDSSDKNFNETLSSNKTANKMSADDIDKLILKYKVLNFPISLMTQLKKNILNQMALNDSIGSLDTLSEQRIRRSARGHVIRGFDGSDTPSDGNESTAGKFPEIDRPRDELIAAIAHHFRVY